MSEFEKLMSGQSKRSDIQKRNSSKKAFWSNWRWVLLGSFVFTLVPPHIGTIVFLPTLLVGACMVLVEWTG